MASLAPKSERVTYLVCKQFQSLLTNITRLILMFAIWAQLVIVISYASIQLKSTERKYVTVEKDALALVFSFKKFPSLSVGLAIQRC